MTLSQRQDVDDETLGVIVLDDLRDLNGDSKTLTTATALNALDERPWPALRGGAGLNARTLHACSFSSSAPS